MKHLILVIFVALAAHAQAAPLACETAPNGTDTKLNWYPCSSDFPVKVMDVKVGGSYPVNVKQPIVLTLTMNNGGMAINRVRADFSLDMWQHTLGKCGFKKVNTFDILNNHDGCAEFGQNCPITPGAQTKIYTIDLGAGAIILRSGQVYQITIHFKDRDQSDKEFLCGIAQFKVTK